MTEDELFESMCELYSDILPSGDFRDVGNGCCEMWFDNELGRVHVDSELFTGDDTVSISIRTGACQVEIGPFRPTLLRTLGAAITAMANIAEMEIGATPA